MNYSRYMFELYYSLNSLISMGYEFSRVLEEKIMSGLDIATVFGPILEGQLESCITNEDKQSS